jgi:MurNAc alpha-1-phosphate uridylyltransferase
LCESGATKLTFSGIGVYHPSLFASLESGQAAKLAPLLREAMAKQLATASYYEGVWHDIGTPERLHNLDQQLMTHRPLA